MNRKTQHHKWRKFNKLSDPTEKTFSQENCKIWIKWNIFLDRYQVPKLNQKKHLISLIIPRVKPAVIISLPTNKGPVPDGFSADLYQTFKEDLIPILFKLFLKIETKGTLHNSFYEATITLNHTKSQQRKRISEQSPL